MFEEIEDEDIIAPLEDLLQVICRLQPYTIQEIHRFPFLGDDVDGAAILYKKLCRFTKNKGWLPIRIKTSKDGQRFISLGVRRIELTLDATAAIRFIGYIRQTRRDKEEERFERLGIKWKDFDRRSKVRRDIY